MTGLRAWLVQRVSAVYMLGFVVFVLGHFLVDPPGSYPAWRDWMRSPAVDSAASVFCATLLAHVWVGIRDVALDYLQPVVVRVFALWFLGVGLAGAGVWLICTLWPQRG
ncbi:MAG: succinate dehydrogenase, hydrophobic membrane anchor protein [Betaproteobacteria bacterium]